MAGRKKTARGDNTAVKRPSRKTISCDRISTKPRDWFLVAGSVILGISVFRLFLIKFFQIEWGKFPWEVKLFCRLLGIKSKDDYFKKLLIMEKEYVLSDEELKFADRIKIDLPIIALILMEIRMFPSRRFAKDILKSCREIDIQVFQAESSGAYRAGLNSKRIQPSYQLNLNPPPEPNEKTDKSHFRPYFQGLPKTCRLELLFTIRSNIKNRPPPNAPYAAY